jgi:hypothetical protein
MQVALEGCIVQVLGDITGRQTLAIRIPSGIAWGQISIRFPSIRFPAEDRLRSGSGAGQVWLAGANAQAVTTFMDDHGIAWWPRGYVSEILQRGTVSRRSDNAFKPGTETICTETCAMLSNFLKVDAPAK